MFRFAIVVALLVTSVPAHAQPPDVLGKCLADNTSGKDRKDLARWIFMAMAAHPDIKQYASANASIASDETARTMGALVTRLLTDTCADETRAALKSGGGSASFELAFEKLGQLAMRELMADKSVNESLAIFQRYVNQRRLAELTAGK